MKIKVLLAALAISAFLCVPAQAQDEPRHELGLSYGAVPNSIWIDILSDVIPVIFEQNVESKGYVGPIGLEYYYHTSPLVGVGAVAVFAIHNENAYHNGTLKNHRIKSYYSLMPSVKFNWLRKDKWGMYSKVALGATLTSFSTQDYNENGKLTGEKDNDNDVLFNFQASLIGVEAGSQQVRGFIELGIGEQGIALAGVRYKF